MMAKNPVTKMTASRHSTPGEAMVGGAIGQPGVRSVLITGASSGIGEGLALHYAAAGVDLFLSGRHGGRLDEVARRCRQRGAQVHRQTVDVRDRRLMADWIGHCDRIAPLDLVIANAGVSTHTAIGDGPERARDMFAVNIIGVLNTVEPALAAMTPRHSGQIGIVSSPAGMRGFPSAPYYSASKAAAKAYGEAMRVRHARDGIGISVILPGFVDSRITAHNRFHMPLKMGPDRAARLIAQGLAQNRPRIAFPFMTYGLAWLLAALPASIADRFLGLLPSKE